jgi:hypothetical protein
MEESLKTVDYGQEIVSWYVPEYNQHARGKSWYFIASLAVLLMLAYAIWTANFLFVVIIIIGSIIVFINDSRQPTLIKVSITDEGLVIGSRFYDYDKLKDFSIVYKPKQGIKNLYFEFKNTIKPRLSIPLQDMNPLPIRENLLRYLTENLERTNESTSEVLSKMFKL